MADHPVRSSHNSDHKPKKSSVLSEASAGITALKSRRASLKDPFAEPKKKRIKKPEKKTVDPFVGMSPSQISRAINTQRIKSASKDTARARSGISQLKGLRKRSKRGPRSQFIEGKTRF